MDNTLRQASWRTTVDVVEWARQGVVIAASGQNRMIKERMLRREVYGKSERLSNAAGSAEIPPIPARFEESSTIRNPANARAAATAVETVIGYPNAPAGGW
jgi:hypothetical protein